LIDVAPIAVVASAAGAVLTTEFGTPLTVIVAGVDEPDALEQTTVMVFAPATNVREFVDGVVVAVPLIVHVVPDGIVLAPLTVKATLIGVVVLFELLAGDAIATTGTASPVPLNVAGVDPPNTLVQTTEIVNGPLGTVNELVVALVVLEPLTVHVVPAGIDAAPFTWNATFRTVPGRNVGPPVGDVSATVGTTPLTVMVAGVDDPDALEQTTVMVFAPATSVRELVVGVVVAVPLIVQVVPDGIVLAPLTV